MECDGHLNRMKEVTFSLKSGGKARWLERKKAGAPPEV
jgi:hypothetical protein